MSHTEQLRRRIDTDEGRQQYAQRVATVERVWICVTTRDGIASEVAFYSYNARVLLSRRIVCVTRSV